MVQYGPSLKTPVFIFLAIASAWTPVWAQSGVVTADQVAVRDQPNARAEILVTLDKGKRVIVLTKKPGWLQVRVSLDKTFSLNGWVLEKFVKWKIPETGAVKPPARRAPKIPQVQTETVASSSPVFTPIPAPEEPNKPLFPAQPSPPPVVTVKPGRPAWSPPIPAEKEGVEEDETALNLLFSRGGVSLGAGFLRHTYELKNRSGSVGPLFSYVLPGIGVDAATTYWYWSGLRERLRTGAQVTFEYGYYRFSTDLQTSGSTTTSSVNSSGSSYDGTVRFPVEYRVGALTHPVVLRTNLGFEYLSFNLDDVQGADGPLRLYVDQTVLSLLWGADARFEIPGVPKLQAGVGLDLLFLNWVWEKPRDTTGTDPKGSLGFVPHVEVTWMPSERHHLSVGYKLRIQNYRFSGTASRVGTNNVHDGEADMTSHNIFARYDYVFGGR